MGSVSVFRLPAARCFGKSERAGCWAPVLSHCSDLPVTESQRRSSTRRYRTELRRAATVDSSRTELRAAHGHRRSQSDAKELQMLRGPGDFLASPRGMGWARWVLTRGDGGALTHVARPCRSKLRASQRQQAARSPRRAGTASLSVRRAIGPEERHRVLRAPTLRSSFRFFAIALGGRVFPCILGRSFSP
jgi:hypothetical protein